MTTRLALLLPAVLLLAGCLGPREQCEYGVTRNLGTLNALIRETEANIARGYALDTVTVRDEVYRPCHDAKGRVVGCWVPIISQERRARAIDLDAERAKLASMKRKQAELQASTAAALRQCQAAYPAS